MRALVILAAVCFSTSAYAQDAPPKASNKPVVVRPKAVAPSASFYSKGVASLGRGDFDAAIVDLTAAIDNDPADIHAYIKRATAYEKKGDPAAAIADYRMALKVVSVGDGDLRGGIRAAIRKLGGAP